MNLTDTRNGSLSPPMHMTGGLMIPDERILKALHDSGVVDDLLEFEVTILAGLIKVQYFEARELAAEPYDQLLKEALMILVEGEIEVRALVNNEPVSLYLNTPGDLARVIS
ncbi:MAG TPA: hypothetical protein VMJ33_07580, partial [Gallionella sp.]|nr:hypothetical protein [Gallionella sp.]